MDPLSGIYVIFILASAALWWALRKTPVGGGVFLVSGLLFFTSPVWTAFLNKTDLPKGVVASPAALSLWIPAICFVGTLAIVEFARISKKAAVPVVLLILLLVAAKIGAAPWFQNASISPLAKAAVGFGLSYYVLRAIATVMELSRGTLRDARTLDLAGYLAFPPILSLGPIERASAFLRECKKEAGAAEFAGGAFEGICRIGEGLFKSLILGDFVRKYADVFAAGKLAPEGMEPGALLTGIFAYSIYLYINFSGATDVAVGTARLFGIKISENFDIPYARPNLSEFWRAWHISLSTWLRDFLFFPIGKRLPRAAAPFVAPFLVMGLCGLWHGVTPTFLAWGLLHGAGLALHQLWLRARRANDALDGVAGGIAGRTIGTVVTVFYVTFTWIFFAAPDLRAALVHVKILALESLAFPKTIGVAALVAAIWSFIPGIRDRMRAKAASVNLTVLSQMCAHWRYNADLICIFIVAARFLLTRTAPEGGFVYANF